MLDNKAIFREISKLGTTVTKYLYEEKFAQDIPLFGGKSNGNFRMKIVLTNPKDAKLNLIQVGAHKVKIQITGKKTCYKCGSSDNMKAQCTDRNVDDQQTSSNVGEYLLGKPQNETETPLPSAGTHIESDAESATSKQNNQTVQVDGQMVPIGVAGTLIPTDENASETNTVLPSAKDGTTFANVVKRPLSFPRK